MRLKIEIDDQSFFELDFGDIVYISGYNHQNMWKIYRSLYYYFNKSPMLSTNIYGDDNIEISLDDVSPSTKNTQTYFISNRDSIYQQMIYKKGNLLFENLNTLNDSFEITRILEELNDTNTKLSLLVQEHINNYANNLIIDFEDVTYFDVLKYFLKVSYEDSNRTFPLEFMETESLVDELLNLIESSLKKANNDTWIVLYNLDSFVSRSAKKTILNKLKEFTDRFELKVIYLGNSLTDCAITSAETEKIVVAADEFHQLLPIENLSKSIKMRYPNDFPHSTEQLVQSLIQVIPYIGNKENVSLNPRDLVLLKIVNDILGYETSLDYSDQILNSAETKFLLD